MKWRTPPMPKQKLKPCPFCGGKANRIIFDEIDGVLDTIECVKCGNRVWRKYKILTVRAVEAWNRGTNA
jgi:DNA-directed RNA polymerase subunit RPC12/RpoP